MGSIGVNERTVMGMDEYIRKESAISIFRAKAEMAVCTPAQPYFDRAAKMLELLPAADVAPVRYGRWLIGGYACGETEWQCSYCKETEWRTSSDRLKYCPFCGAKMDGGND